MRAYLCGKKINAARCARKVIGNPELNRSVDKTRSPRAGHQSHELDRTVGSCHWRLSLASHLGSAVPPNSCRCCCGAEDDCHVPITAVSMCKRVALTG